MSDAVRKNSAAALCEIDRSVHDILAIILSCQTIDPLDVIESRLRHIQDLSQKITTEALVARVIIRSELK